VAPRDVPGLPELAPHGSTWIERATATRAHWRGLRAQAPAPVSYPSTLVPARALAGPCFESRRYGEAASGLAVISNTHRPATPGDINTCYPATAPPDKAQPTVLPSTRPGPPHRPGCLFSMAGHLFSGRASPGTIK